MVSLFWRIIWKLIRVVLPGTIAKTLQNVTFNNGMVTIWYADFVEHFVVYYRLKATTLLFTGSVESYAFDIYNSCWCPVFATAIGTISCKMQATDYQPIKGLFQLF